jgi:hypothetical protein
MNKKQFLMLVIALVALAAAGAGVQWYQERGWDQTDTLAGKKLLPALTATSVAEIALRDGTSEVHLVKKGTEWIVRERADFPADFSRIAELLGKLVDLKIIQSDKVAADKLADFNLVAPKAGAGAGQGTALELKDASGKSLATLLLGKIMTRRGMIPSQEGGPPREGDIPYGRYVISGTEAIAAVSEPLAQADTNPSAWLVKELFRIDPAKSVTSFGPAGEARWALTKANGLWGWTSGDKPDPQKAQDVISALYLVTAKDVVADPAAVETGLAKTVTIKADTPDTINYTVKIGAKADDDSYYMSFNLVGEPPKVRPPEKGESAEDKTKRDKEYDEQRVKVIERLDREKLFSKWTYKMPKYAAELLLRDRAQLMPEKKNAKAGAGK